MNATNETITEEDDFVRQLRANPTKKLRVTLTDGSARRTDVASR